MRKLLIFTTTVALVLSCTNIEEPKDSFVTDAVIVNAPSKCPQIIGAEVAQENLVPGKLIVKVTEEYAAELESLANKDGIVETASTKAAGIGNITSMRRLFPYAGRFEERTRKEGLHLWYAVTYDKSIPATKAAGTFMGLAGISIIEYQVKASIVGNSEVIGYSESASVSVSNKLPFNDPYLKDQWHYYNDGSLPNSRLGCDIGVAKAWECITCSPDVIVSVVDGGIDYSHEDLADNMWHNPEKTGNQQYGYNFVDNSYVVTPDDHGTHIAGTIAAVNNNGKGVCGVAGGDAKAGNPGVKLMSCQVFHDDDSVNPEPAIKWGADHGAVVCQNSWNYPDINYVPSSTKAAIDYFIKYAGVDENGNQIGPIKGGLVFFSAGNENSDYSSPSSYSQVIAVPAVGADFERAYYSNYGSWADIAAPGGDDKKKSYILSTLPKNNYGYMVGTSMACPHVSGAAALLVSYFAKEGATADMIKQRMLENTLDISAYNTKKIGSGLLNVYKAIFDNQPQSVPPERVSYYTATPRSNFIDLAITLPIDEDDGAPSFVIVYVSEDSISEQKEVRSYQFSTEKKKAGETLKCTVSGLDFDTEYHIAVAAADFSMNLSELSDEKVVMTEKNNPPQISFTDQAVGKVLRYNQIDFIYFSVSDPDGHDFSARLEGLPVATSVEEVETGYRIRINANYHNPGSFQGQLIAEDEYGAKSSSTISYSIMENHPPKAIKEFDNIVFNNINGKYAYFFLNQYFTDEDVEPLKYSVNIKPNIAKVSCQDGQLSINPTSYGYADIEVKAADTQNKSAILKFRILVRNGDSEIDIYPNPVTTTVNIRTPETREVDIKILSRSGAIVYSASRTIDPFEPLALDLSSIPAGTYTVVAKMGSNEIKQPLIKL